MPRRVPSLLLFVLFTLLIALGLIYRMRQPNFVLTSSTGPCPPTANNDNSHTLELEWPANLSTSHQHLQYFSRYERGTYPHHRLRNASCPQYLTGSVHARAGLGHKSFNYFTLIAAAQYLELRYLHQAFPSTSDHKNYDGHVAEWLGYSIDEFDFSHPDYRHLPMIVLPAWTGRLKNTLEEAFAHLRQFIQDFEARCNIIFRLPVDSDQHFAPTLYYHVKAIMVNKYEKARLIKPEQAVYNASQLNLAIYLRNGDITPTSERWLLMATHLILNVLRDYPTPSEWLDMLLSDTCADWLILDRRPLPIHLHVFAFLQPNFTHVAKVNALTFHINEPLTSTLYHLINADLVVRSASSFVEVAAIVSTKPLFVHPPTREPYLRWEGYYADGLFFGPESWLRRIGLHPSHVQAILEVRFKWAMAQCQRATIEPKL